jgi:hypothetical protein
LPSAREEGVVKAGDEQRDPHRAPSGADVAPVPPRTSSSPPRCPRGTLAEVAVGPAPAANTGADARPRW